REYSYTLEHIPGRMNDVADCLSRLPCDQNVKRIDLKYVHLIENHPYLSKKEIDEGIDQDVTI
ncbi:hypothetical protein A3Q56_08606, partial [Intoshia linei]